MPKQSGEGDLLFIRGFNVSGDIGSLSKISASAKLLDTTGINKSAHERLYGERDGEISFTAFHNPSAGQEHAALSTLPTADVLVTYLRGGTLGAQAANLTAKEIDYKLKRGPDGMLTFDAQSLANGFGTIWGQSYTTGVRTDTVATLGTSIDGLAATAFGAEFHWQVISLTGTDVTVKFQDSADNSTFADITGATATFTVSNSTAQVITVNTATIRRYVRVTTTTSAGFTNAQFVATMARNEAAGVLF